MKRFDVRVATVADLVDRFTAVCVEQDNALLEDNISKFNRLYDRMIEITQELKSRPGDQRRALLVLLNHRDIQVRLQAARLTLALAPKESRQTIEEIVASKWQPQAGDAGMCLFMLDSGRFVPD
jgi:hypothetical protein